MGAVIWLSGVVLYVGGFFVAAVWTTRWFATSHHCHGQSSNGHHWRRETECRRYCLDGCWSPKDAPDLADVLPATGLGLLWPLLAIPMLIWWLACRETHRVPALTAARIADLERELGIGDKR